MPAFSIGVGHRGLGSCGRTRKSNSPGDPWACAGLFPPLGKQTHARGADAGRCVDAILPRRCRRGSLSSSLLATRPIIGFFPAATLINFGDWSDRRGQPQMAGRHHDSNPNSSSTPHPSSPRLRNPRDTWLCDVFRSKTLPIRPILRIASGYAMRPMCWQPAGKGSSLPGAARRRLRMGRHDGRLLPHDQIKEPSRDQVE